MVLNPTVSFRVLKRIVNRVGFFMGWPFFLIAVWLSGQGPLHSAPQPDQPSNAANPNQRSSDRRMVPWVEVNSPDSQISKLIPGLNDEHANLTALMHALKGLESWTRITDTVIVSTRPGQTKKLYPHLMRQKPAALTIIGGLKTYNLPGCSPDDPRPYDFSNSQGWAALAEEVREISFLTGTKRVLLENETALKPFHTGKASIDFEKLRLSLAVLRESDIQIWWWLPAILDDSTQAPNRRRDTLRLVEAVRDAVPNSVFLSADAGWSDWENNQSDKARRRLMIETVGESRFRDLLYVTPDGYMQTSKSRRRVCYTVSAAVTQSQRLSEEVIIYPGAANWLDIAKEFARLAPPITNRPP